MNVVSDSSSSRDPQNPVTNNVKASKISDIALLPVVNMVRYVLEIGE